MVVRQEVDEQEAEPQVAQAAVKVEPRQAQQLELAVQACLWLSWQDLQLAVLHLRLLHRALDVIDAARQPRPTQRDGEALPRQSEVRAHRAPASCAPARRPPRAVAARPARVCLFVLSFPRSHSLYLSCVLCFRLSFFGAFARPIFTSFLFRSAFLSFCPSFSLSVRLSFLL